MTADVVPFPTDRIIDGQTTCPRCGRLVDDTLLGLVDHEPHCPNRRHSLISRS